MAGAAAVGALGARVYLVGFADGTGDHVLTTIRGGIHGDITDITD